MRYILSFVTLACVIAWLVLSYVPTSIVALPTIAFGGTWVVAWFPVIAAVVLAVFVAVQTWLVFATARMLRRPADAGLAATIRQFKLSVSQEVFWTILPLVMTVGLVLVSVTSRR